jgi:hypothetical protein
MSGSPGIVWPEFGAANLALMFRSLQGPAFTAEEKAQVLAKPDSDGAAGGDGAQNFAGWSVWFQAVSRLTGKTPDVPSGDPHVPGQDWDSYDNCLDDAFRTAAATLDSRVKEHGADKASVAEWLKGQNAVFSNCAGPEGMPAETAKEAPLWLRQDRAYQMAAAHFYRMEWDAAEGEFKAIAADRGSPWHGIAAYMVGRTLIRKAWLVKSGDALGFDSAAMREAKSELLAVIRTSGDAHGPAQHLLNYVNLRVAPDEAAAALGDAIARPDTHLRQDLIDLHYLDSRGAYFADMETARRSELMDWVLVAKNMVKDGDKHALERWRATKSVAWLTAAMMQAQTAPADLMAAAVALPRTSPAWATVAYHRLRLTTDKAAARTLFADLLPDLAKRESQSTVNAFQALASGDAATLDDFVRLGAAAPALYSDGEGGDEGSFVEQTGAPRPTMAGLPVNAAGGERFTPEAATVLNEELPLETLVELVQKRELPPQLEFELAMAVWTRAVLLDKPELAARVTPAMIAGEKGWTRWLMAYDAAQTADDRKAAALLALMRFPSVRPYVNAGEGREEGFVGYSTYRDNWWCAEMGKSAGSSYSGSSNYGPAYQPQNGAAETKPVLPGFITAAMYTEAQKDASVLGTIGDSPAYFGRETLTWVKAHPGDPRGAEMLGFAFRAMRNGCNLEASTGERRQVFDVLHQRYPKSEWAARYAEFVSDPE